MSKLVLFTSGSTKEAKEVSHDWDFIDSRIAISIDELQLTSNDTVLNVLPFNVIGYYAITAGPASKARATLINATFDPYSYIRLFNKYQPTVIALIPRHIELLLETKGFSTLDMSCVRYMVMGSQAVSQHMIDMLLIKGVKLIANWYGSTENPPPVSIAYNSAVFNFTETHGYNVEFASDGECIVNGISTGDLFNTQSGEFISRKENATNSTWKS